MVGVAIGAEVGEDFTRWGAIHASVQRAIVERPPLPHSRVAAAGVERQRGNLRPVAGSVEGWFRTSTLSSENDEFFVAAVVTGACTSG